MCQICINSTFRTECLPKTALKSGGEEKKKIKIQRPHSSQSRSPHGQGERLVWVWSSLLVLAHWRQEGKELWVSRGMVSSMSRWREKNFSKRATGTLAPSLSLCPLISSQFSSHHSQVRQRLHKLHMLPILSPTVKSVSSSSRKSTGGKC